MSKELQTAEQVLRKYFPSPDDLVDGRVANVIIKAMEEYAKTVASNAFGDGWDKTTDEIIQSLPKPNNEQVSKEEMFEFTEWARIDGWNIGYDNKWNHYMRPLTDAGVATSELYTLFQEQKKEK